MKRRVRKIVNFFAFNLLFFALYLNFIHKDNTAVNFNSAASMHQSEAFSGNVVADTKEKETEAKETRETEPRKGQPSTAAVNFTIN